MICKWLKSLLEIKIPELEPPVNHVTFFTTHGGWTFFTFDDNKRYYHGEIAEPESFEGYNSFYIRWVESAPDNKTLVEEFIYKEYKKEWS